MSTQQGSVKDNFALISFDWIIDGLLLMVILIFHKRNIFSKKIRHFDNVLEGCALKGLEKNPLDGFIIGKRDTFY